MTNKRCFFVVGPEGSGTYMMAEALVEAGCSYIANEGNLEGVLPYCPDDTIVIRRSIPHRKEFIDLYTIASIASQAGYDVLPIGILREPNAVRLSVYNRAATIKKDVFENMIGAITCMAELGSGFPILPITYEAMIGSKGFREWLFREIGLPYPSNYIFLDQNGKYYE